MRAIHEQSLFDALFDDVGAINGQLNANHYSLDAGLLDQWTASLQ
jgi:hypothetical protein